MDRGPTSSTPSVAIVMPAYNAAHLLPKTLTAALQAAGPDAEVIVVDPGSNDGTAQVARDLGATRVLELGERAGPARARNEGVALTKADVVLFIDSDCVAHEDVVRRVAAAFQEEPELASVTGSYDDTPPETNFFSLYMNLRHHFTHQRAQREPALFWAGCGAVRRTTFVALGGFDAVQFPRPMVEDLELGQRLRTRGKTRLDPALHVKHLKHWTLRSVIETDIRFRAIPWARMILAAGELPNDLNLRMSQRVAAALSPAVLTGVLGAPWAASQGHVAIAAFFAVGLVVSLWLHRDMIAAFTRIRGPFFALGAYLFHQVHLFYSAATFTLCSVEHSLHRRRAARTGS